MSYFKLLRDVYSLRRNIRKSPKQIKALQEKKLRSMLVYAYEHSPYYHRTFEAAGITGGDPARPEDREKMSDRTICKGGEDSRMKKILMRGRDICKTFSKGSGDTLILDHIDIDIYEGDFTVIMGASGAGKSTLLYALSAMDGITGGKIELRGKRIDDLSEKEQTNLRAREFGFVFQQTHLVSNLTLFENVAVAGYTGRRKSAKEIRERAEALLMQMHVEGAMDRLPFQVSGGEAQRAAIARAVIHDPGLVFADEPTGALNQSNSREVMGLMRRLHENGQSILMVTHDVRAAICGNRILYLEDGKILDEMTLLKYREEDAKEREAQVNRWLTSLQW